MSSMWLWICPSASMANRWVTHISARYHCRWRPLDGQCSCLLFLPPTATVVSFGHQCQDISAIFHHMSQNSLGGSFHFHPRPPSTPQPQYPPPPVHQPSMVPKACSVLEEIFIFFLFMLWYDSIGLPWFTYFWWNTIAGVYLKPLSS